MTGFAHIRGLHVVGVLAIHMIVVVATIAIVRDFRVFESGGRPLAGGMAARTVIAAGDMGSVLARDNDAIVATVAGTDHLGVVHADRSPVGVAMTGLAHIAGRDVVGALARDLDVVVTTVAVACEV